MALKRFQVLVGKHAEDLGTEVREDEAGNKFTVSKGSKVYGPGELAGDIVETERDLDKIFNQPGCEKFRKLDSRETPPKPVVTPVDTPKQTSETLESMTVEQLRAHAAEEEIDLTGLTRKSDIIEAILSAP